MTLDPARPEKNRRGVWGGRSPPSGFGFRDASAARVRVRPHYPELPVPGPRRDMGLGQVLQAESKKRFVHSHPPSLNIRNISDVPPEVHTSFTNTQLHLVSSGHIHLSCTARERLPKLKRLRRVAENRFSNI